jgi:hypothetical protein
MEIHHTNPCLSLPPTNGTYKPRFPFDPELDKVLLLLDISQDSLSAHCFFPYSFTEEFRIVEWLMACALK